MSLLPALHNPTSLELVQDQMQAIETWAADVDDVSALHEAATRLGAIDEYLLRKSIKGRALVAATQRRLEVRIGKLIGPSVQGRPREGTVIPGKELDRNERSYFRRMAEHPEVVEHVIEQSTDDHPASRNAVMTAISAGTGTQAKRMQRAAIRRSRVRELSADPSLSQRDIARMLEVSPSVISRDYEVMDLNRPQTKAKINSRTEFIAELAAKGHSSDDIARQIGISEERTRELAKRAGITIRADEAIGLRARRFDPNSFVEKFVENLVNKVLTLDALDERWDQINRDVANAAIDELDVVSEALRVFRRRLNHVTGRRSREPRPHMEDEVSP